MRTIKILHGLAFASTLGIAAGLISIIPFNPVSWVMCIALIISCTLQIVYLLMVDESEFECALRKREMYAFCVLAIIIASILATKDSAHSVPPITVSIAKNACFWLTLFELYLFKRIYTFVNKEDAPAPDTKQKEEAEKPKHVVKEAIKRKWTKFTLSSAERELYSLIGLLSVKKEILSLKNVILAQNKRVAAGLPPVPMSYHCVFTGNPGTGKTTVARIVAQIYKDLGVIEKGHLVECDRSSLVAGYAGQTAIKTNEVIDKALDGVLFIDEAYTLARSDGQDSFGQEAIDTLLKRMEDDRNRLVVIVAGYTDEMKKFIDSNPGLSSRFNRYIEFPDYSVAELFEIFRRLAIKQKLEFSVDFENALKALLQHIVTKADRTFGNGRGIRNLYEKTLVNQANRLAQKDYGVSELLKLLPEDLPSDY